MLRRLRGRYGWSRIRGWTFGAAAFLLAAVLSAGAPGCGGGKDDAPRPRRSFSLVDPSPTPSAPTSRSTPETVPAPAPEPGGGAHGGH